MGASLLDLGQPSAITGLLQSLTAPPPGPGQMPGPQLTPSAPPSMPGPQASPTPMQAPPKAPPSMMDRVRGHLDSILGLAAPQGYEGLLSPEEIKGAKPSRLRALIGGPDALSPEHQYEERLNHILQLHQLAAGVNDHARVMNARQQMSTLFAPADNETEDQTRQRLAKMYAFAMSHGDEETMKDVGSTLRGIMTAPKQPSAYHEVPGVGLVDLSDPKNPRTVVKAVAPEKTPHIVNATEGIFEQKPDGLYDVATGQKYTGKTLHPVPLAPTFTPMTDYGGADGAPPTIHAFDTKTGGAGPVIGTGKTPTTRVESATNTAAQARLEAAVSEMNNATTGMSDFESKLASKKIGINGLSQFMGATANSFTHDDPASRAIQSAALATLNRVNPDLARYIRRGLSFAEGESMISQRPSDFRTKMAQFLSTAASGASPEMIADIQQRRNSIMTPLNRVVQPKSATAKGGAKGPVPTYEDWKAAQAKKP